MGRKGWVDRAVATGDWAQAESKARSHLRKSNIETLYLNRYPGRPDKGEKALDGKREKAEKRAITLAKAYKKYQKRGGNRSLPDRILAKFGQTRIDSLDRATLREATRKLYPKLSEAERAELVYDPIDEIVGLDRGAPKSERPATPGRYDPYLYWLSRKAEIEAETERFEAQMAAMEPILRARGALRAACDESFLDHCYRRGWVLTNNKGKVRDQYGMNLPHGDNPPTEPIKLERGEWPAFAPRPKRAGGVWRQLDHYTLFRHPLKLNVKTVADVDSDASHRWRGREDGGLIKRGFEVTGIEGAGKGADDKTRIIPGEPPSGKERSKQYARDGSYLGWLSKAGRPRKPDKLSDAEKQRRYRERRKWKKRK